MAKASTHKPKTRARTAPVHEFPKPEEPESTAVAVEEPPPGTEAPEEVEETEAPREQPAHGRGRDPVPKQLSFFERCAKIPKKDWGIGVRATIRVYRLEPVIDQYRGSSNKFITMYGEPIDEQRLKVDHGSGRYRLYLNYKVAGDKNEKEVDSVEIDILDTKYPPRLTKGTWLEDPRNNKWAWAKAIMDAEEKAAAPPTVIQAPDPMQSLDTLMRIEDRLRDRIEPRENGPTPAEQADATLKIVDRVLTATQPRDNGQASEIAALRAEIATERRRGDDFLLKLVEAKSAPPPAASNGLGTLKEILGTVKEFLPTIKEYFPQATGDVAPRREKEPWWTGIATTAIEAVQPAMPVLVHGVLQWAQRQQTAAQQHGKTIPTTATETAPPAVAEPDIWDLLVNALSDDASGEDFAQSVTTLYGQWKYKQACMLGESGLLTFLQNHPIWQKLGAFQDRMPTFLHDFVAYGKDPDDEDGAGDEPPEEDPAQPQRAAEQPIEL